MNKRANLLISNIPADCSEDYIKQWVEARGYRLFSVRLVRDLVTGTSPSFAHVQLMDPAKLEEAIRTLDRQRIGHHTIRVQEAGSMPAIVRHGQWIKLAS